MNKIKKFLILLPVLLHRLAFAVGGNPIPSEMTPGKACFANIGEGGAANGVKSYLPDATTSSRYLLYKQGTDADHCAITGAGDTPLGSSDDQADSTTTPIAINLFGACKGTVRVVTDGTIANGDMVKAGATGKVTKASSTNRSFGMAVIGSDCSSADGDVITIIPTLPALYVF